MKGKKRPEIPTIWSQLKLRYLLKVNSRKGCDIIS